MKQKMKLTKWTFPGCSSEHQFRGYNFNLKVYPIILLEKIRPEPLPG